MTKTQLCIVGYLLNDANIASYRSGKYRLRDDNNCVILTMTAATFRAIKPLLRSTKNALFVIDKNKVRQLHGNDLVKRKYKGLLEKSLSSAVKKSEDTKLVKSLSIHHRITKVAEKIIKLFA